MKYYIYNNNKQLLLVTEVLQSVNDCTNNEFIQQAETFCKHGIVFTTNYVISNKHVFISNRYCEFKNINKNQVQTIENYIYK